MFKHILVPTDGSPMSFRAAKRAVLLARSIGARITAYYASPRYRPKIWGEMTAADFVTADVFAKQVKKTADKYLGEIHKLAAAQKVPCTSFYSSSDSPAEAIVAAARARKCDLIHMASHSRTGLPALLIGSETNKVLAHCKIPVLVSR